MTDTWTDDTTGVPDDPDAIDELLDDLDDSDDSDDDLDRGPVQGDLGDPFEDDDQPMSLSCFEGDNGRLDYEQRRALHALLKNRYISADRHPDQWATLLLNEDLIQSRLNDLFLDLHIDRTYQVAFKRQATSETGAPLPTLLHEVAHNKEETIMLVALRSRFFQQRQDGDSVVYVEKATLLDEVSGMRPDHATDLSFDQKKAERAVEGLRKAGVLLKTPDPDRFRISPVIEVLLPIQKLRDLMTWLMSQNGTTTDLETDADGDEGTR